MDCALLRLSEISVVKTLYKLNQREIMQLMRRRIVIVKVLSEMAFF